MEWDEVADQIHALTGSNGGPIGQAALTEVLYGIILIYGRNPGAVSTTVGSLSLIESGLVHYRNPCGPFNSNWTDVYFVRCYLDTELELRAATRTVNNVSAFFSRVRIFAVRRDA
jgi:hypothetical protein